MTKEELLGLFIQSGLPKEMQKYADQECVSFLNFVNNIPIHIRAKYKSEKLYEAYKTGEKLE